MNQELKQFRNQITEDLKIINRQFDFDTNINKDEYAFNYWVLLNLYSIDEEIAPDLITEYNDRWIDCYVHYEDSKQIFLIQNKYYEDNTTLDRKHLTDFLSSPLTSLKAWTHRNQWLQKIFNQKNIDEYQIYLHFYITNTNRNWVFEEELSKFRKNNDEIAEIFFLDDIYTKYYKKSYSENINFEWKISTLFDKTRLQIKPKDQELEVMCETHYLVTPIMDLYDLYKSSKLIGYWLFEKNIREFLWESSVNKWIITTLKNKDERNNFFYYNNGITIIADEITPKQNNHFLLKNPQVVNWCQTVSSIYYVLDWIREVDLDDFKNVFVMSKILIIDKKRAEDFEFYSNIVKYTNKQNAINEKVFWSILEPFMKIQEEFRKRGFLVLVKQSDKYQFTAELKSNQSEWWKLYNIAKKYDLFWLSFSKASDIFVPLDKLLQVIWAFEKWWYFAYTKKNKLLDPNSETYNEFSKNVQNLMSFDTMLKIYMIYRKAEEDKKNSEDKKTPVPYYVLSFIWYLFKKWNYQTIDNFFNNTQSDDFIFLYNFFKWISKNYVNRYESIHKRPYNEMIKQDIDYDILNNILDFSFNMNDIDYSRIKRIFDLEQF